MEPITESLFDELHAYNLFEEEVVIAKRCEKLTEIVNELIQEIAKLKEKVNARE